MSKQRIYHAGSGVPREQEVFARNCGKDGGGPSGDDFQK